MFRHTMAVISIILIVCTSHAQSVSCEAIIEQALQTAHDACGTLGRNQACYANFSIESQPQSDAQDFQFEQVGDVTDVAGIRSLRLQAFDPANALWGIALMSLQANIPDSIPGQNIHFILFGDTTIRNASDSTLAQRPPELGGIVRAPQGANVRATPSTNSPILITLEDGALFTANGRNANQTWARIYLPDSDAMGWIFADLIQLDDAISALAPVQASQPAFSPMQAFYITSGIGRPACNEAPTDGLLIQSPEGVGEITVYINEVAVDFGSTLFITVDRQDGFQLRTLEGVARIQANGRQRIIPQGSRLTMPVNTNDLVQGTSFTLDSYADEPLLDTLPLTLLDDLIEPALPLTDEELELIAEFEDILVRLRLGDVDDILVYLKETPEDERDLATFILDVLGYHELDDQELDDLLQRLGINPDERFEMDGNTEVYIEPEPDTSRNHDDTVSPVGVDNNPNDDDDDFDDDD